MMAAEVAKEHVSVIAKAFDGDSGYHKFTEDEYKNVIEQLDKGVDVDFYNLICSRHAYIVDPTHIVKRIRYRFISKMIGWYWKLNDKYQSMPELRDIF